MPLPYRSFFEDQGGQFPIELSCPIPFLPIEKKYGYNYQLVKPIVKHFGKDITMEIRGTLCNPEAGKVWVALNQIRKRSRAVSYFDHTLLRFETTFTEICRELGKQNPTASNVHEGILHSLEQLSGLQITLHYRGDIYIGGLIHSATILKEDDNRKIYIYQNRFFADQMLKQFIGINTDIFYSLRGKSSNLYIFLNNFKTFREEGRFNSEDWHRKYWEIYDMAGLKSPLSHPNKRFMYRDLIACLEELTDNRRMINYEITEKSFLIIAGRKQ